MLAAVSVMATGSVAVVAAPAAAQPGQPVNCHPVLWRFAYRHSQYSGPMGCAVGWEFGRDGGLVQDFVNGQMAWSPRQGEPMVVSAYHRPYWDSWGLKHGISIHYGLSNPFNYDRWLIRLDHNGVNIRQDECIVGYAAHPCTRTEGWTGWNNLAPGVYRIVVQGCDWNSWTGHHCNQGWTNPIWVWF